MLSSSVRARRQRGSKVPVSPLHTFAKVSCHDFNCIRVGLVRNVDGKRGNTADRGGACFARTLSAILALAQPASGFAQQPETLSSQITAGTPDSRIAAHDRHGRDRGHAELGRQRHHRQSPGSRPIQFYPTSRPNRCVCRPGPIQNRSTSRAPITRTAPAPWIVKKPLPINWDAKVGADLGLATNSPSGYDPRNPLQIRRDDPGPGAAWASLKVPQIATIDARVDPRNDQGRLGTHLQAFAPDRVRFCRQPAERLFAHRDDGRTASGGLRYSAAYRTGRRNRAADAARSGATRTLPSWTS